MLRLIVVSMLMMLLFTAASTNEQYLSSSNYARRYLKEVVPTKIVNKFRTINSFNIIADRAKREEIDGAKMEK